MAARSILLTKGLGTTDFAATNGLFSELNCWVGPTIYSGADGTTRDVTNPEATARCYGGPMAFLFVALLSGFLGVRRANATVKVEPFDSSALWAR
jgi:hypothetical protein